MIFLKKILWVSILSAIVLMVFSSNKDSTARASDQVPAIARSFSQYFSPQVFRAVDNMMKTRFNCQPEGYWKIWTYGFHRKCKRPEGKLEIILNWDGMYYIKNTDPEITGDWTLLK